MRYLFFILALASACGVHAQNFNGIWKGKLLQDPGGCFGIYNIELQVNFAADGNTLTGRAFEYLSTDRYAKFAFSGRYNSVTKRMVLIESALLDSRGVPVDCVPCIKTYDLNWSKDGSSELLTGECKGYKNGQPGETCPPYKLRVARAGTSDFLADVKQSPELAALQKSLQLQPRDKELVQQLSFDTSKIRLDLYDNAEIDNDTVTVLLNNKLLLYRKMLTDKPLTLYINAFPDTDYELVMYADNLGSIPPNTALLVITAGEKKYELRLVSSEQKSAAVRFRYKKN